MDSLTGIDDDQDFFESYDAGPASVEASFDPLEFEAQDQPPTPERLAHLGRFRRPVAAIVAVMSLLSLVALVKLGSQQQGPEREPVAHYGSALAATESPAPASVKRPPLAPEASSELVPEALSTLLMQLWAVLTPDASSAASAAAARAAVSSPAAVHDASSRPTALSELFVQPRSSLVKSFFPARSPMCSRATESDFVASDLDAPSQLASKGSSETSDR